MAKVRLTLGDKVVEAEKIEFKTTSEPWSSYLLSDGNVAKIKLIVSECYRLPDRDPITGLPQYVFKSTNVAAIEAAGTTKGDN
jgi:hypothetical protein